jgi:predicted nucleotidyltransferase
MAKLLEIVEAHKTEIVRIVMERNGANPRVFGSVARGEDTATSDVDILIDRRPGLTLFRLAEMELEIERLLGVGVDVVTSGSVPKHVIDEILAEAKAL